MDIENRESAERVEGALTKAANLARTKLILFTASSDYLKNQGLALNPELLKKAINDLPDKEFTRLREPSHESTGFRKQLERMTAIVMKEYSGQRVGKCTCPSSETSWWS